MRNTLCKLALTLSAVSCGEATTGPYYEAKAAPPSGLSVALQIATPVSGQTDTLSIAAAGDSVTASAVVGVSGCMDYIAVAGQARGLLVITVIETPSDRLCVLVDTPATLSAVVRSLPRGDYRVEYRKRVEPPQRAPFERVLGRQSIRIP